MALRSMAASQLSSCAETRSGEKEQQPDKTATRPSAPCLLLWAPRIQVAVRRLSPGMMGSQFSGSAAPRARSTRARCWVRRHRRAPSLPAVRNRGLKRLTSLRAKGARPPAAAAPGARPAGAGQRARLREGAPSPNYLAQAAAAREAEKVSSIATKLCCSRAWREVAGSRSYSTSAWLNSTDAPRQLDRHAGAGWTVVHTSGSVRVPTV